MDIVQITKIISQLAEKKEPRYQEFLRKQAISSGVYFLPRGSEDKQEPHSEDEIYYILMGKAQFEIGEERQAINSGDAFFVSAGVHHRFLAIEQDLFALVIFAPSEGSIQ